MAIETWIDSVVDIAGAVSDGNGGTVRAYYVFKKPEWPDALTQWPCALTMVQVLRPEMNDGSSIDMWEGTTEFHLTPGVDKNKIPYLMGFFGRIRAAFALHRTLGGKVSYIGLQKQPGMQLVILQYGLENPHYGITVPWIVKENVSGTFTLGA